MGERETSPGIQSMFLRGKLYSEGYGEEGNDIQHNGLKGGKNLLCTPGLERALAAALPFFFLADCIFLIARIW